MDRRPWPDRVAAELARRGVPAGFRSRLLRELRDHVDDLMEEGIAMTDETVEARLGTPEQVAAAAADEYRRAGWVRRHPLLAFGLAPVPLVVGSLVLYCVATVAAVIAAEAAGDVIGAGSLPRPALVAVVYTWHHGLRFAPFVLAGWWVGRLVGRHRVGWVWAAAGVAQVAALAGLFVSRIVYSDVPGQAFHMVGFCLPGAPAGCDPAVRGFFFLTPTWAQVPQLLAPVAAAAAAAWLVRRRAAKAVAA